MEAMSDLNLQSIAQCSSGDIPFFFLQSVLKSLLFNFLEFLFTLLLLFRVLSANEMMLVASKASYKAPVKYSNQTQFLIPSFISRRGRDTANGLVNFFLGHLLLLFHGVTSKKQTKFQYYLVQ